MQPGRRLDREAGMAGKAQADLALLLGNRPQERVALQRALGDRRYAAALVRGAGIRQAGQKQQDARQ